MADLTPAQVATLQGADDLSFAAAQMSLDLCHRKPGHALLVKLPPRALPFRWYRAGREPLCRKVEGSHGAPLVSFALAQDCGDCDHCRPPAPLVIHHTFQAGVNACAN